MATEISAASLFLGPDRGVSDNVVLRHDGGVITDISEAAGAASGSRSFVIPAFVNAHDHARATASSFGAVGMPLESWILRAALGTPVDPYLTAASALARSARAGCAAMMVHYTRPSGTMPLVDEAKAIAKAASDVGIRIAFALAVRDQNPIVYGDAESVLSGLPGDDRKTIEDLFVRAPMSPKAYIELTDAIAAGIAGPMVDVQLGPAGVQWCSKPLLEAVAENSARIGRRIHMHLLETVHQRAWADQHFPDMVRWLRDVGFLSERLTLAHCIHARPDELEMIAASGARIVTNFSSNMHLRSGLAPIAAAHKCGCAIAVGVDGLALDEDDDILREMRLVQMAHGGLGFKATWTPAEMFSHAIRNGRRATGAPGSGELAAGNPADYVVIDLVRLDRDRIMPVDPMALLFARGNASLVQEVVVAGKSVARDGGCLGVDLPAIERELRDMYRANVGKLESFRRLWPPLSQRLGGWFEQQLTCQ
ncbi:amidohydrolase [Bradyrhizobium sacchari]|uniref:Cytosine/adenosine deaminase-related metal-dependent hydrolase n=1 Tax=Bradyrhizobium sacchari TaxID=1399419 RepID=A0A560KMP0_9BRAD|nr:amidohydrolase family protein [Bradyrhizobium sacchari]OPY96441.1 amidohydrolase [Bradyrhizobium sacchari]TWB67200.1 cytosine/adenosine deaminase-related metal-dependent hydrolase [Bradyrhizobium sacchari]TWB84437.1 cytosine/adenosine deaminase-related metal-dependent hydrolase [Bradyrhizobium sacchari]